MNESSQVHKHLSNGMEVFINEQHFSPVCSISICVKAGSIDENQEELGMAHVLEHMLFKGTENFPIPGHIAKIVESAGGDINAYTTFDRTVYELSAPSEFIKQGSEILIDMVQNALLDAEEHKRETEVIVEEIKRGLDSPGSRLSKTLFASGFQNTEMGRPIIGSEESVRAFTADGVRAFYNRWYIPNNMIFVASGDFNGEDLFSHLQNKTSSWNPGSVPERTRPLPKEVGFGKQINSEFGPFQDVRFQLATRAPALEDESLARWDVFASLLGQGDTSRLAQTVKDQKQLVSGIDSGVYSPKYPSGLTTLGIFTRGELLCEAIKESLICVQKMAANPPTESEVNRVFTTLKAERVYAVESVEGIVRQSLSQLLTSRGLDFEDHYLKILQRVTPTCIQKTAQEYLEEIKNGRFTLCAIAAQELENTLTEENLKAALHEHLNVSGTSATGTEASKNVQVTTSELNANVKQIVVDVEGEFTVHVNFRKTEKIPAVSFGFYATDGLAATQGFLPGTGSLMAQMLTRGTESLSYRDFVTDLENRAASIQSFQGRDLFGVRGDCLSEDFEHVFRLSADCIFHPGFENQEFQRVKRESVDMLRAQKDSPFSQLSRLTGPMLYADHPYATPIQGHEDTLPNVTLEDAKKVWSRLVSAKRWTVSIAGDFDEDGVASLVTEVFKGVKQRISACRSESKDFNPSLPEAPRPQKNMSTFGEFDREQAHLILCFRGADLHNADRTSLEVAMNILSGQGGRLFGDLREKRSLAYTVSSSQSVGLLGGSLAAYIGTSKDKAEEAFFGLKQHLEILAMEEPLEEEVARARQSLLGGQALDSQQLSYQCAQLAYSDAFGLGFDHFLKFRDRVNAVTPAKVKDALFQLMSQNPLSTAVIGPKGTWQPSERDLKWNLDGSQSEKNTGITREAN